MSWWLAVPLGALIVLGGGVVAVLAFALLFKVFDWVADRMSERARMVLSVVFTVAMLLLVFGAFTAMAARWLAS